MHHSESVTLSPLIFSLLVLPFVKLPLGGGTGGTWLLDSMVTVQPSQQKSYTSSVLVSSAITLLSLVGCCTDWFMCYYRNLKHT